MADDPGQARWQAWDDPAKEKLKLQLAELAAKVGLPTEKRCPPHRRYATPGEMALDLDDKVVQRPHMSVIDQAFAAVKAGETDRVILMTPPQVGKTHRVIWGMFWWMVDHPNDPMILASYGSQLAQDRGYMVRQLVEQHGAEFGLVRGGKWARNNWETSSGAALRTGGMDSGLTGNPAAMVVIDDPHKDRAEADSPTMRKAVWKTYSSSVLSRLRPGGPIILVQTRWHDEDLAGMVLKQEGSEAEGGRWRVLHMEAITTGKVVDPLGRGIGEPLTHPWIPEDDKAEALRHWKEKKATSSFRDWAALYQGDPQPAEGSLLTEEQINNRTIAVPADPGKAFVSVDPSGGGRDVAGVIGGQITPDGKLMWTHDRSAVMGSDQWSRVTCLLAFEIGADVIVAEHNYGGDMVRLAIRTAWDALKREHAELRAEAAAAGEPEPEGLIPAEALCPRIKLVHSKKGKLLRAEPVAQLVIEDHVRFGPGLQEFKNEWMTWQVDSKESPGRLDAGVHLAYAAVKVPGADARVSTVTDKTRQSTGVSQTAARQIQR